MMTYRDKTSRIEAERGKSEVAASGRTDSA
jgi:hypothetical protein